MYYTYVIYKKIYFVILYNTCDLITISLFRGFKSHERSVARASGSTRVASRRGYLGAALRAACWKLYVLAFDLYNRIRELEHVASACFIDANDDSEMVVVLFGGR